MDKNFALKKAVEYIFRSDDLADNNWDTAAFVFSVHDGSFSNSGFTYLAQSVTPAIADIDEGWQLIDNAIIDLQLAVYIECNERFKQILIQIDNTGRIHAEFEFESHSKWTFSPQNLSDLKEALRPIF